MQVLQISLCAEHVGLQIVGQLQHVFLLVLLHHFELILNLGEPPLPAIYFSLVLLELVWEFFVQMAIYLDELLVVVDSLLFQFLFQQIETIIESVYE